MSDKTEYLTQEKYKELQAELLNLKTERRREVAEQLEYAKSLGDLAENAEYHEARTEQANVEDRINRLEAMMKAAVIVSKDTHDVVEIGSTVTLDRGGKQVTYTIVGSEEANVESGKLSIRSPIGEAMIGKRKGDFFECKTPGGKAKCKILEVK
ncbi:MAG: transcription elongation factor GreA [bacterium]|nr:transcription elongation factor GreA [bacterium]